MDLNLQILKLKRFLLVSRMKEEEITKTKEKCRKSALSKN